MDELKMQQSNSQLTAPGSVGERMDCHSNRTVAVIKAAVIKTEMVNQEVADATKSHSERSDGVNEKQNICDNPVKMEHEPNAGDEKSCESGTVKERGDSGGGGGGGDDRTSDAKLSNGPRSKLIYSCHRCKSIFNSRISFELHYKETYNETPVYTCLVCEKQMKNRSSYQRHYNGHTNTKEFHFKCTTCAKTFAHEKLFKKHSALHNLKMAKLCTECQREFFDLHEFKAHCRTHDDQKKNDQQKWQCADCGKILKNRSSLTMHTKIHKNDRQFCCVVCDQKFVQKINLINHVKALHCAIKSHSCEECGKSFVGQSQLLRHHTYHTNVRSFECEVCKKMYKTKRDLKLHLMVHSVQRPHKCSSCEKTFLSTSKLKQHLNIHTGSRPYKCDYCPKDFTNFPNWLKHTRRRHKVDHKTGEKLVVMPKFLNKVKKTPPPPPTTTATTTATTTTTEPAPTTSTATAVTAGKPTKPVKPRRTSESRKKKQIERTVQNIKNEAPLDIVDVSYVDTAAQSSTTSAAPAPAGTEASGSGIKMSTKSSPASTDLSTIMVNDKTLPLNTSDDLERAASLLMQQTIDLEDEIEFMDIKSESNDASFYQHPYNFYTQHDKLHCSNVAAAAAPNRDYCPSDNPFPTAIDPSSLFSYYSHHTQSAHYDFTMMPLPPINTVKSKLKTMDPKHIYTSTANVL